MDSIRAAIYDLRTSKPTSILLSCGSMLVIMPGFLCRGLDNGLLLSVVGHGAYFWTGEYINTFDLVNSGFSISISKEIIDILVTIMDHSMWNIPTIT